MTITINNNTYEVNHDLFPGYDLERLARWFNQNRKGQDFSDFVRFWQNKISSVDSDFKEMKS